MNRKKRKKKEEQQRYRRDTSHVQGGNHYRARSTQRSALPL